MNLRETLRHLGIKYWLFDLDDSLIKTNPIFVEQMKLFALAAARSLVENETDVYEKFKAAKVSRLAILGDSLGGDIRANHKIGVPNLFYVPSGWVMYSQGEIPAETHVLKTVSDLIPTLEKLAAS